MRESEKTNEIPVPKAVLPTLPLVDWVCTANALHTHADFMHPLHEPQADTVLTVKGNQLFFAREKWLSLIFRAKLYYSKTIPFASHKKRSGPFPVVYYKLQSEISRRDLVIALDHTVCSDGAWKSESGLQADTPHFWSNISTGERIFLLITPFRPPIIALGHMGIQGSRLRTTHRVRDAFVRAEHAIMSFSGTKIPAYEITSLLGSVQEQQVQLMKMYNELERLSQLKMIKQCPKCGEWVRDEPAVIECPLCLYHFDTTNDLQQQKRKDGIQQQIQWVSRPIGVNAGPQPPVRALPPRALSS